MAKTTVKYRKRLNPNWRLATRVKKKNKSRFTTMKIVSGKKREGETWDTRKSISDI